MPIVTIHDVRRDNRTGIITVLFGKIEREFYSVADVKRWVRDNLPDLSPEQMHAIAMRDLMQSVGSLAELGAIKGKVFDVQQATVKEVV